MLQHITTTDSLVLFEKALTGQNMSRRSIQAYKKDLAQFVAWVGKNRIDWNNPVRFTRIDIIEFLHHLAAMKQTGVTRARKLAAMKKYFHFLKENTMITNNPAETVKGIVKEEKEPAVLQKNEYKALLFESSGNPRDYAILQLFLQTGIRVGELVNILLTDLDLENKMLVIRQGKGKKDRTIPLEEQALQAIKHYLKVRDANADCEALFVARNGTSLDVRSVRYIVHKYMVRAGIRKKASVHTLRHTYGTHKIDRGMTIPALQELLGHKKKETTFKYIHLATTSLRQQQEQTAL